MTDFTPTDMQAAGIKSIETWFKSLEYDDEGKLLDGQPQIYRVFGYAGTGKTTITKRAIGELGINEQFVRYAAFTGKAAYVMRKHGTPAQTIHSLIYSVIETPENEIEQAELELQQAKQAAFPLPLGSIERMMAEADCQSRATALSQMKRPHFGLNPESLAKDAELIVLDEVSMVGPEMAADLLSYKKPILVLGDPGQLPPIKGEGAFTQQTPDVMLTEVHRQAEDSAIIRLATMARLGESIPHGRYSDLVWKLSPVQVDATALLKADQVIVGKNATRRWLNQHMRAAAGFDHRAPLPMGGEKIICLKNDNAKGLINGMFVDLRDPDVPFLNGEFSSHRFDANLWNEDGEAIANEIGRKPCPQHIYRGHFEDHVDFDDRRDERDWNVKRKMKLVELTYGWAITGHKSQGSQWPNVVVWDDGFGKYPEDRKKWLYTVITRAESGLVILE